MSTRSNFARLTRRLYICLMVAALPTTATLPGSAQATAESAPPLPSLAETARAFLTSVQWGDRMCMVRSFPRTGDFAYFHTLHQDSGIITTEWRFPASFDVFRPDGPLWNSLDSEPERQRIDAFVFQVQMRGVDWTQVTPTRFVPPGEGRSSHTFVE